MREYPSIPIAELIRHANPMGTLHGGVLCDIADAAMGMAYASTLPDHESFTTLELKINFLKPFWEGKLPARGHIVKRGRIMGRVRCLYDPARRAGAGPLSNPCIS